MSEDTPKSFSDGRYVVIKKLGEGGKGVVFKCLDGLLNRNVAVKMIKTSLDEETASRFRREAQTTARLSHQNIVSVYDIGNIDSHPFLVIEYVDGKSLDDVIKDGPPLSPFDIVRISKSIAEALEYSHSQGILHRDIKPENIMITRDGIPKLMDFGLARSVDSPRLTHAGAIVGTPAYISPESALGRGNDARSDLYSLGCVMYAMATAHPPFVSGDNLKLVYSHINDLPVPIGRIRRDFPADLEAVIMRLLSKDPVSRYQSASDLLAVLRSLNYKGDTSIHISGNVTAESTSTSLSGFSSSTGNQRRPLVGRDMETRRIRSLIDAALTGAGSMILVAGQTGTGKTRILEEARGYASLRGFTVISVKCSQSKSSVPRQTLSDLFRNFLSSQPVQMIYKICGDYADQMEKIVPEVAPKLGKVPEFPGLDAEQQRIRMNEAVSTFIENMSRENPLLVTFDDVHFIDSFSLTFFRYYYELITSQRVVFMGASIPLDEGSQIMKAMGEALKARILEIIELGNLDRDATRLLICNYLGERPDNISENFLDLIYKRSYGNPLFLEETIKYLIDKGQLYRLDDGTWSQDSLSSTTIPISLRRIARSKIEGLEEDSLNLLRTASVIGHEFDYEVLRKLSGIDDEDRFMEMLENLIERKFLSEREGKVGSVRLYFTDPQVREILYGDISMIRKRKLHESVGEAIEESSSGINMDSITISSLAEHFQKGGNISKALKYRKMEADLLSSMAEFAQAAISYENCLDIVAAFPFKDIKEMKREEGMLHLQIAKNTAGTDPKKSSASAKSAMEIFREIGDNVSFIEAARLYIHWDLSNSEIVYKQVESIRDSNELLPAKLHFFITYSNSHQLFGDINEAKRVNHIIQQLMENNREIIENIPDKSIILYARLSEALFREMKSEDDIKYFLLKYRGAIDSMPPHLKWVRSTVESFVPNFYFTVKLDLENVKGTFIYTARDSEQSGVTNYVGVIKLEFIYFYSIFANGFESAKQELDNLPRRYIASNMGTSHETHFKSYMNGILIWYYLANGDREQLFKTTSLVSEVEGMQFRFLHIIPELFFYMDTDDNDGFLSALERADRIYSGKPWTYETVLPRGLIHSMGIEVFARTGQIEKASERFSVLRGMASDLNQKWLFACQYRARASMAIYEKRFKDAEDLLKKSIEVWKDLGIRFFAGRDYLLLASSYNMTGNLVKADESLNLAMELFTEIGAKMYAQKVLSRKELLKA